MTHEPSPLYVIGAGGHGAVVAEIAEVLGYRLAGFVDDNPALWGMPMLSSRVLGGIDMIPHGAVVALGIGHNAARLALWARGVQREWVMPTLAHPSAVVSSSAMLGTGTVVMAQAVVNARATIGSAVILNTACSVDHDCHLADGAHICPGVRLAGTVTVGARTMVGIGSCVRQGITIGSDSVVGAGAVVVAHLPDGCMAYGNPATIRRSAAP